MKSKAFIGWVCGIPLLVLFLMVIIVTREPEQAGISRAQAAKSAVLAMVSGEELAQWRSENPVSAYPSQNQRDWYVPYMDYLYGNGYLSLELTPATRLAANENLTYEEAAYFAEAVSKDLKSAVKMSKKNRNRPFPENSWWLFYDSFLRIVDAHGQVESISVMISGTPDSVPGLEAWTACTNLGKMRFEGLSVDRYLDCEVQILRRGNDILRLEKVLSETAVYANTWLGEGEDGMLKVWLYELEREFAYDGDIAGIAGNIADVTVEHGKLKKISLKKERITGKVLSVTQDTIEIAGYGKLPLAQEFQVFKTYGTFERQNRSNVLVGYEIQEFVVADGAVCAALTVRKLDADLIRVLLTDSQMSGYLHESVTLVSDGELILTYGAAGEGSETVKAGQELTISNQDKRLKEGRLTIHSETGQPITVKSLARSQGEPAYQGNLEIVQGDGGLLILNEVYLEDYLKRVVPSEMPASYEMEALKAQAVCARTYAYGHINSNSLREYGAHVDDTVRYQVYNNVEQNTRTDAAVDETYGTILFSEDKPISAFYFSTSCGNTTDASIWGGDADRTPYLKSIALQPEKQTLTFGSEDEFASFIKNNNYPSYDSDFAMYRWDTFISSEVLTKLAEGDGVGEVQSISVIKRGAGGIAQEVKVNGTGGSTTWKSESVIRAKLRDASMPIQCHDGSVSRNWASLPSAYIYIEPEGTDEKGHTLFHIYGGGYGHGVGMSQNGAQGMAKAGMTCEQILKFFYQNTELGEV